MYETADGGEAGGHEAGEAPLRYACASAVSEMTPMSMVAPSTDDESRGRHTARAAASFGLSSSSDSLSRKADSRLSQLPRLALSSSALLETVEWEGPAGAVVLVSIYSSSKACLPQSEVPVAQARSPRRVLSREVIVIDGAIKVNIDEYRHKSMNFVVPRSE